MHQHQQVLFKVVGHVRAKLALILRFIIGTEAQVSFETIMAPSPGRAMRTLVGALVSNQTRPVFADEQPTFLTGKTSRYPESMKTLSLAQSHIVVYSAFKRKIKSRDNTKIMQRLRLVRAIHLQGTCGSSCISSFSYVLQEHSHICSFCHIADNYEL